MIVRRIETELGKVADIIMAGFYSKDRQRSPFSGMVRLAELNRLQQNFPYADPNHFMYVATTRTNGDLSIVAFCDVDGRPATRRFDAPRPYLSDLVVHPHYRRRGIAKRLVEFIETRIVQGEMESPFLYIRVERDNDAARIMYQNMDYRPISHPIFGIEDTTVLLRKDFEEEDFVV